MYLLQADYLFGIPHKQSCLNSCLLVSLWVANQSEKWVRGDRGGENVDVARFMIEIVGRSAHNLRIERLWGNVSGFHQQSFQYTENVEMLQVWALHHHRFTEFTEPRNTSPSVLWHTGKRKQLHVRGIAWAKSAKNALNQNNDHHAVIAPESTTNVHQQHPSTRHWMSSKSSAVMLMLINNANSWHIVKL